MLALPPGGATMRWVLRRGTLSSTWAPANRKNRRQARRTMFLSWPVNCYCVSGVIANAITSTLPVIVSDLGHCDRTNSADSTACFRKIKVSFKVLFVGTFSIRKSLTNALRCWNEPFLKNCYFYHRFSVTVKSVVIVITPPHPPHPPITCSVIRKKFFKGSFLLDR